jgi:hypothetical protein
MIKGGNMRVKNIFYSIVFAIPLLLLLSYLFKAPDVQAAEFSFHPSIAVSEEYTDNVDEVRFNKRSDFITRLLPGLSFDYKSPFWDWNAAYVFDYRHYARNTRDDEITHNLTTQGQLRIINEFFYIDLSDTYSRASLNIARDVTKESLSANQSDTNNLTVSPYFVFHPGLKTTLRTGYRYINVWYKEPEGIDRQEHIGYADVTYELSPRLSLLGNYTYTRQNSIHPFDRHTVYAGGRYEYGERSFISAQAGYTLLNLRDGGNSSSPYWNAGITHAFKVLTISFAAGVQYPVDPLSGVTKETDYSFSVIKDLQRGSIGATVSYARFSGESTQIDVTDRYGLGITAKYDFAPRLQGSVAASIEKYDHNNPKTYTRRIVVNPALIYSLPKEIVLSLSYMFIDVYSPGLFADNYEVNRVMLEARKTF